MLTVTGRLCNPVRIALATALSELWEGSKTPPVAVVTWLAWPKPSNPNPPWLNGTAITSIFAAWRSAMVCASVTGLFGCVSSWLGASPNQTMIRVESARKPMAGLVAI
jgi:hypothetical protein